MNNLPSRDDVKADIELLRRNAWTHNIGAPVPFSSVLAAYAEGRLVDRDTMTPMYRQGGLSGAWYPVVHGEPEPDGWLVTAIGDTDSEGST